MARATPGRVRRSPGRAPGRAEVPGGEARGNGRPRGPPAALPRREGSRFVPQGLHQVVLQVGHLVLLKILGDHVALRVFT